MVFYRSHFSGVVFCNVGQGDSAYIHLYPDTDIVIDGGPESTIPSCISRFSGGPDFDIELLVLTHAHSDHYNGLIPLIKRFPVQTAILPLSSEDTAGYRHFLAEITSRNITVIHPVAGDIVSIGNVRMDFHWPPTYPPPSCAGNENMCSYVFTLSLLDFDILFTGDAETEALRAMQFKQGISYEVLKVPHHGSRDALTRDVLERIKPLISVVSVGKDNQYQHPDDGVIGMLGLYHYRRTDRDGNVIVQVPLRWYQSR